MTDAAQLREALDLLYEPTPDDRGLNTTPVRWPLDVIGDAARTIALPILEQDQALVERVAGYFRTHEDWVRTVDDEIQGQGDFARISARAVLAALIPTEGEGE